jgi:hypothetical protein
MSLHTRKKACDDLARVTDPATLSGFAWALSSTKSEVKRLTAQKDAATADLRKHEAELDRLMRQAIDRARKQGRPPPQRIPLSPSLSMALDRARRRCESLQADIDEEFTAREYASRALGAWLLRVGPKHRPDVLEKIVRGPFRDRDFSVRAFYTRALGGVHLPEATRLLLSRLSSESDPRVLPVVIDAVARQSGEMAVTDLAPFLGDTRWPIRAATITALGRIGSPAAIQPLIDRLRVEGGRLRGDIVAALTALTGKKLGVAPDRWQDWWDENREGFVPPSRAQPGAEGEEPEAAPAEETVSFYGIEILSKRVVFVIDISGSMLEPAAGSDRNRTKIDVAKYELERAILGLPDDAQFNVISYSDRASQWRKGLVKANRKERRAAVKYVREMKPEGPTNIFDALEMAFALEADTIFFLSDGMPNRGAVTDSGQILSEVKRWNEKRRVKIHTVGLGGDHDIAFMKGLAESSGGQYVAK